MNQEKIEEFQIKCPECKEDLFIECEFGCEVLLDCPYCGWGETLSYDELINLENKR